MLLPFYELVNDYCNKNCDTLNLNQITHAVEEGNTMSDFSDSPGIEQVNT